MYHLLVVEDESLIRRGIRAFIDFDRLGIDEFFEAENGEEGLEAVRSHRIDLILADINMPKMNGLEFCRLAKELDPSIKIAILTGYDYLDYAIRAIKIGVDDYALKPLSRDDVQKLLFHLVEKKKEADNFAAVRQAVDKLAGANHKILSLCSTAVKCHAVLRSNVIDIYLIRILNGTVYIVVGGLALTL